MKKSLRTEEAVPVSEQLYLQVAKKCSWRFNKGGSPLNQRYAKYLMTSRGISQVILQGDASIF